MLFKNPSAKSQAKVLSKSLAATPAAAPHTPPLGASQRIARACLGALSALLLGNGVALMALGHIHTGVLVPAVLGLAGALLVWRWPQALQWRRARARNTWLWRGAWGLLATWVISVVVFCQHLAGVGVQPEHSPHVQAIVVLGSSTHQGQPRPVLAARLDAAAELARLQPSTWIAVCGGTDWGEDDSQAAVMARYLTERHGIAPGRIVQEGESTSTELNMQWSQPLLEAKGVSFKRSVAVVSSDFHLLRARAIAQQQGWSRVVPIAAPTPLPARYNAWLREYFAMASSWALGEMALPTLE